VPPDWTRQVGVFLQVRSGFLVLGRIFRVGSGFRSKIMPCT
jgi:hypothetical protein